MIARAKYEESAACIYLRAHLPGELESVDDATLAHAIRREGRALLLSGSSFDLHDVFQVIPNLRERPVPLDAAIEFALRSINEPADSDQEAIEKLVASYPELREEILVAAQLSQLSQLFRSTHSLRQDCVSTPQWPLPSDFGPSLSNGEKRYQLVRSLGDGSTSDVYLAIDRNLSSQMWQAPVAIKLFRSPGAGVESAVSAEAIGSRQIDHANTVNVFDRGVCDGFHYIVYEHVVGGDLQDYVGQLGGRLPVARTVELLIGIARGVQAAHSQGMVHLDIKPANVLLTKDGAPKVADFGLVLRNGEHLCESADVGCGAYGTLGFMAPEQFDGAGGVATPQADIYAVGGLLYWLIIGEPPNGSNIIEVHDQEGRRQVRADALDEAVRSRFISKDLALICERAIEAEPSERYGTAEQVAVDLESWRDHRPIAWTNPTRRHVMGLYVKRRPVVFTLAVFLACALVGVAFASESARRIAVVARQFEQEAAAQAALAQEQEHEVEVQAVRLEEEQKWKVKVSEDLFALLKGFAEVRNAGLAGEVLTSLWVLEWVYGPILTSDPADVSKIWRMRIEIIRDLLENRRAEGGRDSLEALQLESLLAFWLSNAGEFVEAEPLIASNIANWEKILKVDDPWLMDMRGIELCASANRILDSIATEGMSEQLSGECLQIESGLLEHVQRLANRPDGAQLRHMMLTKLKVIYSPQVLANDEQHEWATRMIDSLDLSVGKR